MCFIIPLTHPFSHSRKNSYFHQPLTIKTTERNGPVVSALSVRDADQIMLISQDGKMVRMPVSDFRTIGRNTQGVTLIGLSEGDILSSVAKVITNEQEDSDSEE